MTVNFGMSFQVLEGALDGLQQPRQPSLARAQGLPVVFQGGHQLEVGPVDGLPDLLQAQAQLAQKENLLEPQDRRAVVLAIAVGRVPSRPEQADLVVVVQRAR